MQNCTTYRSFAEELPQTAPPQTGGVNICRLWQLGVSGAWHWQHTPLHRNHCRLDHYQNVQHCHHQFSFPKKLCVSRRKYTSDQTTENLTRCSPPPVNFTSANHKTRNDPKLYLLNGLRILEETLDVTQDNSNHPSDVCNVGMLIKTQPSSREGMLERTMRYFLCLLLFTF